MGIVERRQRQKDAVRASILDAAWKVVEQEGWQALSIRKIADAIEYSVPVIYDHFENKEAILLEFTRNGFRLLHQQLQKGVGKFSEPALQLEAIADEYWKFAFSNAEYYRLMYGLGMPSCDTVRQIPELNAFTDLLRNTLQELITTNSNRDTDVGLKFHTFWSTIHGLIAINMMGKEKKENALQRAVLHDFVQSFIRGISG